MMTPVSRSSRASSRAFCISTTVSGRKAFLTWGRFMVIFAIPCAFSYLMSSNSPPDSHCMLVMARIIWDLNTQDRSSSSQELLSNKVRWLQDDLLYSLYMHPQTYRSLTQAREFMRHAYGRPVSLPDVAAQANLSPYHFLRIYKQAYGETPHEFLTRLRIERAKTLLAKGSHNVTEACFEVGFSSLGSFSNLFAYRVGLSPSEYRRHARSTISVPSTVRTLFVPSCFFTMLYGTQEERNNREAGRLETMVSSGQST